MLYDSGKGLSSTGHLPEMGSFPVEEPEEDDYCFNKIHFTHSRSDFDVQRIVEMARRRASLDQLHNDLRMYLRSIQNSMVKLINEDYAEFLNLSSNLATMRESIEKLSGEFEVSANTCTRQLNM